MGEGGGKIGWFKLWGGCWGFRVGGLGLREFGALVVRGLRGLWVRGFKTMTKMRLGL